MRLYIVKATVPAAGGGEVVVKQYVGSKGEVNRTRKALAEQYEVHWKSDTESEEVEVPTNKAGLIDYLNELVAPPAAEDEEVEP